MASAVVAGQLKALAATPHSRDPSDQGHEVLSDVPGVDLRRLTRDRRPHEEMSARLQEQVIEEAGRHLDTRLAR